MTFEEYLRTIEGLTDEQVSAIVGGMSENKLYISSEENIDERYGKLKSQRDDAATQLADANKTIKDLKDASAGNDDLQTQIADYEKRANDAEAAAAKAELESAVKVELLSKGAVPDDIDYLMYRIAQGEEAPKLEGGKLSGFDDVVKNLKTRYPAQFGPKGTDGAAGGLEPLPGGKPGKGEGGAQADPKNLAEALKQKYDTKDKE